MTDTKEDADALAGDDSDRDESDGDASDARAPDVDDWDGDESDADAVAGEQTDLLRCAACGFVARSAAGLVNHSRQIHRSQ